MDQHGKAAGTYPKVLPPLPTRKQNTLVLCFMADETGYFFFLSPFIFSSHDPFSFDSNIIDLKKLYLDLDQFFKIVGITLFRSPNPPITLSPHLPIIILNNDTAYPPGHV